MSGDVLELPDPADGRPVAMMPEAEAAPRGGTARGGTARGGTVGSTADRAVGKETTGANAEEPDGGTTSGGCAFNDDSRLNPSRGIARGVVLSVPIWALIGWALYLML